MSYRIEAIDRLTNSRNGNPRFALALTELDDEGNTVDPIQVINTAADPPSATRWEPRLPGGRRGTARGRGTWHHHRHRRLPDMESSVRS